MPENYYVFPLIKALREAMDGHLNSGWLYLQKSKGLNVNSLCMFLPDEEVEKEDSELDELGIPVVAIQNGFPHEGLDTQTIEGTCEAAAYLRDPPDDALLVKSFEYYLRFDAFLQDADGPFPTEQDFAARLHAADIEYYDSLGNERPNHPCKRPGCDRGAVNQSVFCRVHHFESIKKRACPTDHELPGDAHGPQSPAEEVRARERSADLEFYESLGDERPDQVCKRPECDRGAINGSVLCRIHHFESIKQRPSPFHH